MTEPEKTDMQKIWERDHPAQAPASLEKVSVKEYPQGKNPVTRELHVPADQAWLLHTLNQQTKLLKSISTAVQILAALALIGVILAACSAIMGSF